MRDELFLKIPSIRDEFDCFYPSMRDFLHVYTNATPFWWFVRLSIL